MIECWHSISFRTKIFFSRVYSLNCPTSDKEPWPDDSKDHHEDKDQEIHLQGAFDQAAEDLIKRVKHAIANGEGCQVFNYRYVYLLC